MFFTSSYAVESRLNVKKLTKEDNTNRPTLTDAVTRKTNKKIWDIYRWLENQNILFLPL